MQENMNEQKPIAEATATDAVIANPPFGGTGGGQPQSNPEHHLSNGEAIPIRARLAAERTRTVEDVTALEMGANRILKKYMQKQRNWARRRAKTVEWNEPTKNQ